MKCISSCKNIYFGYNIQLVIIEKFQIADSVISRDL